MLSVLALSCAPSANTTRTRGSRSGIQLIHKAAGSNGALRAAGPGKVPVARRGTAAEAGRESGRSGFGALKRRPARDPATARLSTHTSRVTPTHPETLHSYARRPKAAASAADVSRSHHRAAETSLQRQHPRAHYASLWAASSARAGQLPPNAALRAGGRVAATAPAPSARGAQQQRHHRWLYCASPCAPASCFARMMCQRNCIFSPGNGRVTNPSESPLGGSVHGAATRDGCL